MTSASSQQILRSAGLLMLAGLVAALLLAGVQRGTAGRIALQQKRAVLASLNQILPTQHYNNPLHADTVSLDIPGLSEAGQKVLVYRARWDTKPVAAIFRVTTGAGYNGDIQLLIGIYTDGTISGVRVIAHRETPGLGDAIEVAKSNWVLGFTQRSLQHPEYHNWQVRRDGGEFDQFTGATITPRAIVHAVRDTLTYFSNNQEQIFTLEANADGSS